MKEEWKDIEGYEGYYQVSSTGNVRRLERLVDHWRKNGHLRIQPATILKPNNGKYITTFDSVAEAGRALGKKPSAIAVVARGSGYWSRGNFYKAKQAYGYIWKYIKLKEEGVI